MSDSRQESKEIVRPDSAPERMKPKFPTRRKHSNSDTDIPKTTAEQLYQVDPTVVEKGLHHLENELIEKNSFLLLTGSGSAIHSLLSAAELKTSGEAKISDKLNVIVYNSHGLPAVMYHEHQHLKAHKDKLTEKFKLNLDSFALVKEFKQKVSIGIPYTKDCRIEGLSNDNTIEKKMNTRGATVIAPICYESDLQLDAGQQEKKLKMYLQVFRNFSENASMVFFYFSEYFDANDNQSPGRRNKAEQEKIGLWMSKFGHIIIEDIRKNKNKTIGLIHRANWIKTPEYIAAQALSEELKKSDSTYKERYATLLAKGNETYFMRKQQNQLTPVPQNNTVATSAGKVGLLLKKFPGTNEVKPETPQSTTLKVVRGITGEISFEIQVLDAPPKNNDEAQAKAAYMQSIFKGIHTIFNTNMTGAGSPPKENYQPQQTSPSGSPRMAFSNNTKQNG